MDSETDVWINNYNPATQDVVSRVPCATQREMEAAAEAAQSAFGSWRETSLMTRQQVMFKLQRLIRDNMVGHGGKCDSGGGKYSGLGGVP